MSALERFLEPLDNVRAAGEGYRASCPVPDHGRGNGDQNPSLSVGVDVEGTVLVRCFAGCPTEGIVTSIGLTMTDLFERRNGSGGRGGSIPLPKTRQYINRRPPLRCRTTRPTSNCPKIS